MPWYLISFDDGSMDRIPHEDWPEVGERSHAVVQEAEDAGVWISDGVERLQATFVTTEGAITDGPHPETKAVIGGVLDHRGALTGRRRPRTADR